MKTRILSAAVLLPLFLVVVLVLPAWATAIVFGAVASLAVYELMYRTGMMKNLRLVIYAMVMAFLVSLWSLRKSASLGAIGVMVYLLVLLGEFLWSFSRGGKLRFERLSMCLVCGLLIPYLLTAMVRIRAMYAGIDPAENALGKYLILIPCILTFTADSAAYFVGKAFGKHKLAPVISPKKTIEGAVGGVIATVLLLEVYALILDKAFGFDVIYGYGILYGILGSTISILGDLTFSVVARPLGIKDYGNLLPGHGGALDRFVSMILVAPATEILLLMLPMAVPMAGVG